MSSHASKRTLYAALAANAGIAIAKFCGAAFTRSSAMVSEGIHSLVYTGNQVLMLYGMKDASWSADASHPNANDHQDGDRGRGDLAQGRVSRTRTL